VRAPVDKVRSVRLDFPHYPEFMPHYEACRLLGRTADGGQDVYMKVGALHGAVTMWARVEVCKPHDEAGMETYDTRFVDGNVRKLESTFRLKRIDDKRTMLEFEVFLHPGIPLPSGIINQQNIDGAKSAVLAYKARSEGRKPPEQ
jgi:ribosome-associated toxin RatA of RatAB toxin-antitoxin module